MCELKVYVGAGLGEEQIKTLLSLDGGARLKEVAHALLVEHSDDRAEIQSVDIEKVSIDPDYPTQVEIEFETSWSIYKGCEDRNLSGCESELQWATYTADGHLMFIVPKCLDMGDHIPTRSLPFFRARLLLSTLLNPVTQLPAS